MQAELLKKTINAGAKAAKAGVDVARVKDNVTHAVEDTVEATRRAVKRGRYAAEDMMEDTTHCIKQHPWEAIGVTFGMGMGIGLLLGILAARSR